MTDDKESFATGLEGLNHAEKTFLFIEWEERGGHDGVHSYLTWDSERKSWVDCNDWLTRHPEVKPSGNVDDYCKTCGKKL